MSEPQIKIQLQAAEPVAQLPPVHKSHNAPDPVLNYCNKHSTRLSDSQEKLKALTLSLPNGHIMGAQEVVNLNCLLIKALGARRVLDIGVLTGYSAMSAALVMPPDGKVVACDLYRDCADLGLPIWREAGVADKIDLRIGPALDTLDALLAQGQEGQFDFAFVDADKVNALNYYERCLSLLRPGGIVSFDNTLWSCRVMDPQARDQATEATRRLNAFLANDDRVLVSMLPIGDGLTLVTRK